MSSARVLVMSRVCIGRECVNVTYVVGLVEGEQHRGHVLEAVHHHGRAHGGGTAGRACRGDRQGRSRRQKEG